ncbi:hypothetical protein GCM10017608_26130 [Agromyces luteolus]|uniref:Lipoprotein n=1 Tax=Agromyces luteolus TaxID=88373 RepID=A0A7C9LGS0_9MICO|nr:hypothetical protein [Agromyces luteolus]MUN08990.1 hypothetical protein [Agromyces luteolus]GLK28678.1 hypothetical protein GCM10017608_26130 [Agromyces luteolus]
MPRALPRLAALAITAAMLGLAACAAQSPEPTPAPTTDAADAPLFATDEEALAAAVAAYEAHLAATAGILSGEQPVDAIREVSSREYGEQRVSELTAFLDSGLRASGSIAIDSTSLVETYVEDDGTAVSIYACQDVSGTTLLNADGKDVTPPDRDERVPLVLQFRESSGALKVSGNELWSGDDFC